jgi:hypothetical protein
VLGEHVRALAAHDALELPRDAVALHEHIRAERLVPVGKLKWEILLRHLPSGYETTTQEKRQKGLIFASFTGPSQSRLPTVTESG